MKAGDRTDWLMVTRFLVYGLLAFIVIVIVFTALVDPTHEHGPWVACRDNLLQLGCLARLQDGADFLEPRPGSAFFTQFVRVVAEEDLAAYLCPCDPDAAGRRGGDHCSYYGPDEELLGRLLSHGKLFRHRGEPGDRLVIACCPRHEDGVVVLYDDGRAALIRWEDVEGSDGDPVPIGPDSPDPRFRHLVR